LAVVVVVVVLVAVAAAQEVLGLVLVFLLPLELITQLLLAHLVLVEHQAPVLLEAIHTFLDRLLQIAHHRGTHTLTL
jgi:hypothetical protein